MKRSQLKPDPEKVRAWLDRSRQPLARTRLSPRSASRPSRAVVGSAGFREAVWRLCGGRCVMTGAAVAVDASSWVWNAHHVIQKQGLPDVLRWEPMLGVVLTFRSHERHTLRVERVGFQQLPVHVVEYVDGLGEPWVSRLLREHPHGVK